MSEKHTHSEIRSATTSFLNAMSLFKIHINSFIEASVVVVLLLLLVLVVLLFVIVVLGIVFKLASKSTGQQ